MVHHSGPLPPPPFPSSRNPRYYVPCARCTIRPAAVTVHAQVGRSPLIDFATTSSRPSSMLWELTPKQQARVDKVTLPLLHARETRMPEPSTALMGC